LFTLLQRTARDAAAALTTEVALEGRGGTIRVDIQILAVIQGALLQLVRNAVAHGIEPAADRATAGKDSAGRVVIEIVRRGQRLVFSCADDGRGIDFDAVRRFARRQGVPAADISALGQPELLDLLFKGGISTSSTVSAVSGRGIGLDIVREAAEHLGGAVRVTTGTGKGTTVEIDVPFTVASLPALKVEAGGETVLLPLDAVRGCVRVTPDAIVRTGYGQSVVYDGEPIPLGTLDRAVAPNAAMSRTPGPSSIVVLQEQQAKAAFVIDRVLGSTTVVVRPLPDLAPAAAFVAGASLDEEGVPRIVLDPETLIAAAGQSLAVRDESKPARPSVLVIDDSLTTRMLEQSILESAGYSVDLATSGEEGLKKALEHPSSLFLVDVEMPGMDGFTFIERAKAEPALRDIPSILVTSRNSPEDRRRGQEVGARGYVVKGEFDQGALLERIRGLIG
jgi:two-component system chemotaxis sensor kinase CheA